MENESEAYDVPFTQYARRAFSWEDQVRAAQWLARHYS